MLSFIPHYIFVVVALSQHPYIQGKKHTYTPLQSHYHPLFKKGLIE